jgi:hypothetical protein
MTFEEWVPDIKAVDREAEYLARQYGQAVATRYRKIAMTPPCNLLGPTARARKSTRLPDNRLTSGMKQLVRRQYDAGLTPLEIADKWSIPVAAVSGVLR